MMMQMVLKMYLMLSHIIGLSLQTRTEMAWVTSQIYFHLMLTNPEIQTETALVITKMHFR